MIAVKKITLTPAQIIASFGAPINVLAAPVAGSVNNILGISHDMVFVSAAYTGALAILYFPIDANNNMFADLVILTQTQDVSWPCTKEFGADQLPYSTTRDLFFATDALAANGDSPIDVYIIYETVVLT